MPVYLIRAGTTGPVKIGYASNTRFRLKELQVAHFEILRLIREWEGGAPQEAALHLRFADLHIRGEWYSFSRLMLRDVGLVEIKQPSQVRYEAKVEKPETKRRMSAEELAEGLEIYRRDLCVKEEWKPGVCGCGRGKKCYNPNYAIQTTA